jgi:Domain of unknown function (DUF4258)
LETIEKIQVKTLSEIQYQLQAGAFDYTRHAFKRAVERNISDQEIIETSANVIIIEDYPEDKYSPSCLLLGLTTARRVLHIQVSRLDSDSLKIITLYEPDTAKWINYKIRKE